MGAAGAKQGKGTWQPAVVVAYKDTTGEHVVGVLQIGGLLHDRVWLHNNPQQRYCKRYRAVVQTIYGMC
jgi:hypothetical protein